MSSVPVQIETPPKLGVFANRDFRFYMIAGLLETMAVEMQSTAIGWHVYALHHRNLDLGLVGLAQFVPAFGLSLFTGHAADRFDRRKIMLVCVTGYILCSLALLVLTQQARFPLTALYSVLIAFGVARAFAGPADHALVANLVPADDLSRAVAWNSSVWQIAVIVGPTLGGGLYVLAGGAGGVYAACGVLELVALVLIAMVQLRSSPRIVEATRSRWTVLLGGVRYVREHPLILGSISLDLFAVLLGGAVALLPAVASDVLHVNSVGLGALRSAPAVGAAAMALLLANRPMRRRAGAAMLWCVAIFGIATVVFGLSRNFYLSLGALVIIGASDMVSVVVRQALLQLATPDSMRGRVTAVNMVFVGASNELGQFESGVTAEWLGTIPAILVGGVGTIVVVVLWALWFPALRKVDRLEEAHIKAADDN